MTARCTSARLKDVSLAVSKFTACVAHINDWLSSEYVQTLAECGKDAAAVTRLELVVGQG